MEEGAGQAMITRGRAKCHAEALEPGTFLLTVDEIEEIDPQYFHKRFRHLELAE
jgi:hypothetical protein